MKIKIWIKYDVGYLPTPRCRKLRYREEEDYVDIELKEVKMNDIKKAFKIDDNLIYCYDGRLWTKAFERDIHCVHGESKRTALEALIYAGVTYSTYFGRYKGYTRDAIRENREEVIERANDDMSDYLLVDGELYKKTAEPMYNITTFGLGHNHGGTGFFIDYHYNPNISKDSYFNALEYEKAMDYAIMVAKRRGDTIDAAKFEKMKPFGEGRIIVYDKSLVKRNPQAEHGEGNPLLKSFEQMIEASDSATEAGLLVMATVNLS